MELQELIEIPPYSLNKSDKEKVLNSFLSDLCRYHARECSTYAKMIRALNFNPDSEHHYSDIPFLPVRLFKMFDLISVPGTEIVKIMMSSGTTGQAVSKIYLDRGTSVSQTKVLTKIVSSFLGTQRAPMIIIDSESTVSNRVQFSARAAGILGFSMFGTKRIFALDDQMQLKTEQLKDFIEQNQQSRIFIFGFTFMIFQHFINELVKLDLRLNLENAVLIHGGGWKKLTDQAINSFKFRELLKQVCGIKDVHDYYGMVEQTGSIYMECGEGNLHSPIFSDVMIRKPFDFSLADRGEKGIIQVVSVLPKSYPGHSLLTEDEGILLGEDDCKCGRLGKYFRITGRLKNAEIRGCSDTYATRF